ncbi:MAG: oxygenase MpaB family protein, partial [Acidimicrobiia bacterium]
SDFGRDPLGRLRRTASFVGVTAYGTSEQAEQACAVVRSVHDRVVGHAPDGRPYSANDPELLDWVHVTEFGAFAAANRRYAVTPMTRDELDRYVAEVARIAVALGDPAPPRSWGELDAHLERHRPMTAVGSQARAAWRFLEDPPLPGPVRAAWPVLFRGAMACLPPWATELWGVSRPTVAERAACRAAVRSLGAVLGTPPGLVAATDRALADAS